jgi:ribonucleoside-diphosphate reductase alpha chain
MSDKQDQATAVLSPTKINGNDTKAGMKDLTASSIYFKVAVPKTVVKRDGRIVSFDITRIENALQRCFAGLDIEPKEPVEHLAQQVVNVVAAKYSLPTVEGIQDIVEMVLQSAGEYDAAKA